MEKIGLYVVALALSIPLTLWNAFAAGFAIVHLNRWFVVPTFGTPEFGYWTAAGFALLANMLGPHADLATETTGLAELGKRLVRAVTRPWLVLGFGAMIHFWLA